MEFYNCCINVYSSLPLTIILMCPFHLDHLPNTPSRYVSSILSNCAREQRYIGWTVKTSTETIPVISWPLILSLSLVHKGDRAKLHPKCDFSGCIVQGVTQQQLKLLAVGDGVYQDPWSDMADHEHDAVIFDSSFVAFNPLFNLFMTIKGIFIFGTFYYSSSKESERWIYSARGRERENL